MVEPTLEIADRSLNRIVAQDSFEFINDFSSQITVGLLFRTMGLPERDHAEIRRKVILAVSTDKAAKGRTPEHIAAFKELSDFLTAEVAARRANPTDDLITHLAEAEIDGDRLTEREVVLTTATFVMAGVELLSSFMSMFALNLHDYPDARRRLVADPALIAPAIEESLRFNTSAQRFKRVGHARRRRCTAKRSAPATRSCSPSARPIATNANFPIPTRSISTGGRWDISASAPANIFAWAPDGAASHGNRHAPLPRARAGLSPHRRQVAWNSSSNFRSPVGAAVRGRLTASFISTSLRACAGSPGDERKSSRTGGSGVELVGAQLARKLIEHGVDHAGLVLARRRRRRRRHIPR